MIDRLRWLSTRTFTPVARVLLRWHIGPDAVTILGTLGVVVAALWLFPTGHLFAGTIVIVVFVFSDALDGTMARMLERRGPWGAFLDSTLDRIADAALFAGLAFYFLRGDRFGVDDGVASAGVIAAVAALGLGAIVPYARARAEGLQMTAHVGIAERGDRLAITLAGALAVGLGLPPVVLVVVLALIAAASVVTVVQRMAVVRRQAVAIERALKDEAEREE